MTLASRSYRGLQVALAAAPFLTLAGIFFLALTNAAWADNCGSAEDCKAVPPNIDACTAVAAGAAGGALGWACLRRRKTDVGEWTVDDSSDFSGNSDGSTVTYTEESTDVDPAAAPGNAPASPAVADHQAESTPPEVPKSSPPHPPLPPVGGDDGGGV